MKTSFALASALAADYSKAAFTVLVLGGIGALFLRPRDVPTSYILAALAIGALLTAVLVAFAFFFNHKNNRKLKANDHV